MKKVLVCALAALFLMASCLTALADATLPSYVTTTTYVMDGTTTKLQVNTNVTGADEGTMLTYLAYTGETADDNSIIYIDQQTADADKKASFNYTTAEANITGVTVKYGSSVSDSATTEADVYNLRTINVTYNGTTEPITLPTNVSTTVTKTITTGLTVGDYESYSAKINGVSAPEGVVTIDNANKIVITDNAALVDGAAVIVTIEEKEVIPAPVIDAGVIANNAFTGYEDNKPVEKMTVFGKADTTLESDWGGIIVTDSATVAETMNLDNLEGATKYPALYRGDDGSFAVQLVNKSGENELTTKPWYAKIYVTNAGGTTYSNVIEFNIETID